MRQTAQPTGKMWITSGFLCPPHIAAQKHAELDHNIHCVVQMSRRVCYVCCSGRKRQNAPIGDWVRSLSCSIRCTATYFLTTTTELTDREHGHLHDHRRKLFSCRSSSEVPLLVRVAPSATSIAVEFEVFVFFFFIVIVILPSIVLAVRWEFRY